MEKEFDKSASGTDPVNLIYRFCNAILTLFPQFETTSTIESSNQNNPNMSFRNQVEKENESKAQKVISSDNLDNENENASAELLDEKMMLNYKHFLHIRIHIDRKKFQATSGLKTKKT